MPRKDPGMPYDLAPMLKARFGQPDDCADLVNKYGTYNIQPTSDTENLFPLIAPGLPEQWKRMAVGKKDVENLQTGGRRVSRLPFSSPKFLKRQGKMGFFPKSKKDTYRFDKKVNGKMEKFIAGIQIENVAGTCFTAEFV